MDFLFPTLISKTFALLGGALLISYVGAEGVILFFRRAYMRGESYVTARVNEYVEQDLMVDDAVLKAMLWPSIIINIVTFFIVEFSHTSVTQVFAFSVFALTDGISIGIVLLARDENLGKKVLLLTSLATIFTGLIGFYSNINFAPVGNFLFFALLALLFVSIIRLFIRVGGWTRRIIASVGIIIFIGYLLYDFSELKKASRGINALNNWATAMDFSLNIYLDIINLFLNILDALSDDN